MEFKSLRSLKTLGAAMLSLIFTPALMAQYNCPVNCKPNVEVSAGYNCNPTIQPWQVLNNYQSYCNYQLTVFSPSGSPLGNSVPPALVGQTLNYSVVSGGLFCMGNIKVIDNLAPIAICDLDTRVSLSSNGTARVFATAFDDGSYDNCGVQSVLIARKVPGSCPPGVEDDTQFRAYVEVCCNDIYSSPLKVILQVTDYSGNTNDCWAELYVEDKLPPNIVCPTDITISCDYDYVSGDFSDFGKVVKDPYLREPIIVVDPFYAPDYIAGLDGLATDNCGLTITESFYESLDCGQGTIERVFTAKDNGGMSASCVQKITITDLNPFDERNIRWPDDIHITDCPNGSVDPSITGRPQFSGDFCSMVATGYNDWVFTIAEGACFKILREWSVLDWCQYKPNVYPPKGIWSHTQVIKVQTMNKPVFENCAPVEFCGENSSSCSGRIVFVKRATGDCTPDSLLRWSYMIDIGANGQYNMIGQGNDISGIYPFGTHRVRWTVEDLCGNQSVCIQQFTVKDCKEPSPVCYHGLSSVVMPISGELTLNAEVFNAASFDNCTAADKLRFAYSNNPGDSLRTFTCDNLDSTEVEIWVFDESGNSDFCRTYIVLRDNHGACLDSLITFTSGMVYDPHGNPVSNAVIDFISADLPYAQGTSTNELGSYDLQWYLIPETAFGTISATKNDDPLNGFTSFDLLLIQLYIAGLTEFTSLEQFIAADINNDGEVTVADVVEGRRIILGQQTGFANNNSWRMFPEIYGLKDMLPGSEYPPEELRFEIFRDSIVQINFNAVKTGDVNASARASLKQSSERSSGEIDFYWTVLQGEGEDCEILIGTKEMVTAASLQFSLALDIPAYAIEDISFLEGAGWHYNVISDEYGNSLISVSIAEINGILLDEGEFMKIRLNSNSNGNFAPSLDIADSPTPAEMALGDGTTKTLSLQYQDGKSSGETGLLTGETKVRVAPNPTAGPFWVNLSSNDILSGTYILLDAVGKEVRKGSVLSATGEAIIQFDANSLPGNGVYYFRFIDDRAGDSKIVKILRL